MSTPHLFYTGRGGLRPEQPKTLPETRHERATDPAGYQADQGLVDAVNVALLLGKPLLLTGEPGTGKTQLAFSVAHELGLDKPLRFDTKSTSKSKDLFYTYDALGRFRASRTGADERPALDFLTYQSLGRAIVLTNPAERVRHLLPAGFEHSGPRRSVVLIDEVDKAPRDFPNDLLAELEESYFLIPELDNAKVGADLALRPVVIITSNSEKHLPDAFLRRCVYYDIPFPPPERLKQILASRLGALADPQSDFVRDAMELFGELRRDISGLSKKPATDELIGWLLTLRRLSPDAPNPLAESPERARFTLSALVKMKQDQAAATAIVDAWLKKRTK